MSNQIRDLRCKACGAVMCGVASPYKSYPPCAICGGEVDITWEGGKAPSTDVYGSATYSDATGEFHTSQREKVKAMRDIGFEEAGDKVGGARKEHRLKGTGYFYPGQSSHRTVSEGT